MFSEQVRHGVDRVGVETGEWFVEDQGDRRGHDRRDHLHALLIAERQLLDTVLGSVGQAEPFQ